jgi:hypothetical protein
VCTCEHLTSRKRTKETLVLILMNDFNFDCPKYWINLDDLQDISETDMSWFDSQHPLHERIQVISPPSSPKIVGNTTKSKSKKATGNVCIKEVGGKRTIRALVKGNSEPRQVPITSHSGTKNKRTKLICHDMDMIETLKKHNEKFAVAPLYEPSRHSFRDVRKWETKTGRLWSGLKAEERVAANEEIKRMKNLD